MPLDCLAAPAAPLLHRPGLLFIVRPDAPWLCPMVHEDLLMTADRPILGIALMTGFCMVAPLGDATAKVLGQPDYAQPVFQVHVVRFALQALFLICLLEPSDATAE